MSWLKGFDEGDHCLLALHSPYTLILWDTTAQTKVWSATYSESLLSFDVNPFHAGDIAGNYQAIHLVNLTDWYVLIKSMA